MKKVVGIVVILLVLSIVALSYQRHRVAVRNQGTVIPWQPVEFTYKNYTDSPSIDVPEFYEIVKQEAINGQCNRLLTKYTGYPTKEVEELAKTNTEAMFEMFARDLGSHYLDRAYDLDHTGSIIIMTFLDEHEGIISTEEAFGVFDKYMGDGPLALMTKTMVMQRLHQDNSAEISELKKAGNYSYISALSVILEYKNSGRLDHELLCEAYFNGCEHLYELKNQEKIKCENI